MPNAPITKAVFRVNAKLDSLIHTPTTLSRLAANAIRAREPTVTIAANVELRTAKKLARKTNYFIFKEGIPFFLNN